jgi:hypothetical protein
LRVDIVPIRARDCSSLRGASRALPASVHVGTVAGVSLFCQFALVGAASKAKSLGTGLGDRWRAPQGHSGWLKEHVEEASKAA